MPPFRLLHLDHVVLRVVDIPRSERFYVGVLGAQVARRREDLGLVHLKAGSAMIDLVAVDGRLGRAGGAPAGAGGRNVDHICLRVEPFDEAVLTAYLQAEGFGSTGPAARRFGAEGEGPSLYLQDPDGNVVELKGPPG